MADADGVRAQAPRHPQARLQRDPHLDDGRRGVLVRARACPSRRSSTRACCSPSSSRSTTPTCRTPPWRRRWRSCTRASAPTPSRAGTARIRTATSPTTARSTPCAATSTGCTRARRSSSPSSSARTPRRSCRSSIPNGSDSSMFDNTFELLILAGRSPAHAMMMMIPEPWSNNEGMDDDRRAFYQYHSCLMEPWDGPASIAFTDGVQIGAVLDRNGLRPSRYYVTKDGLVIMASEAGVLDIPPENVLQKGRLQPGRMFLVDTEQGRIIEDEEIKRKISTRAPVPPVAQRAPRPPERHARRPGGAAARPPHAAPAPDRLRLHQRGRADHPGAHGPRRRRGRRLDGQRRRARGALEPAPAALRLLQAALRPGHQPPDRLHPRGDHHRRRDAPRLRGQPAQPAAVGVPPRRAEVAHPHQRGVREAPAPEPPGPQGGGPAHPLPGHPRGEGPRQVARGALGHRAAHDRGGRGQRHHRQRPRREPGLRAGARPAGDRRPAPLPHPRGPAHPGQPRPGDRARRARCITSRCSSATAAAPSTPTSPSRPSTT